MHQHRLALAQAAPVDEREVRGQVVHRDRGRLLARQRVGEGEGPSGREYGALARAAVRHRSRHPLPRLEARPAHHRAGDVDPERERRLGTQLVQPLAQQQVREGDTDRVHVDEHVVLAGHGLLDVPDDDVRWSGGRDDLGGAHARIMPRPRVGRGGRAATVTRPGERSAILYRGFVTGASAPSSTSGGALSPG